MLVRSVIVSTRVLRRIGSQAADIAVQHACTGALLSMTANG